jgi:hypothetical protein
MSARSGSREGPNWALILGLLVGVVVALAIFIPAIMSTLKARPAVSPTNAPVTASSASLPGPLGGSSIAMDVNTLVGRPAPAFTLADSEDRSFPVSPGGGTRTVLIFNMGVT